MKTVTPMKLPELLKHLQHQSETLPTSQSGACTLPTDQPLLLT
jgi:hypothetical protein